MLHFFPRYVDSIAFRLSQKEQIVRRGPVRAEARLLLDKQSVRLQKGADSTGYDALDYFTNTACHVDRSVVFRVIRRV